MQNKAHENAANSYNEAAKSHKKAAEHCAAGNPKDAADCLVQANAHSNAGHGFAKEAVDLHAKKTGTK